MKPFSTYPEDRAKLLALAAKVENATGNHLDDAADELADLVRAILEDEAPAAAEAEACGGAAFPQGMAVGDVAQMRGGMSLRQWYAGHALASVAAAIMKGGSDSGASPRAVTQTIASVCVELADALIAAERAKAVPA